jgi:hypothetical protein
MYPDKPVPRGGKSLLIPVLVCAALCVAMMRTGFFSLFFLVPLGFCAAAFGPAAVWLSFIFAALGNAMLAIGFSIHYGAGLTSAGLAGAGLETLFFTTLALGFTWIMAGNPPYLLTFLPRARTAFRFIAASIAGSAVLLGMIYSFGKNENFIELARSQIEAVSSGLIASSAADAVQQEALERILVPEKIIDTIFLVSFRGGALVSMFFMFFICRQAAFVLARLIMRKQGYAKPAGGDLIRFHAPKKSIWVFSFCLLVIVACSVFSIKHIEIAVWNLLMICAIMFLAQGGGIVLHYLARRPISVPMRLFGSLLFVFLVFSPGVNLAVIAALVLLGIAENWLPLRVKNEK